MSSSPAAPSPRLEAFRKLIEELVTLENHSHTTLSREISKVLEEASKGLPDVTVAYCGSYGGGFELSDDFCNYMETAKEANTDADGSIGFHVSNWRVMVAACIPGFGRHCAATHPDLAALLRAYVQYDLDAVFNSVFNLTWARSSASQARATLADVTGLDDTLDNFGENTDPPAYMVQCDDHSSGLREYTKDSLLAKCEEVITSEDKKAEEVFQALLEQHSYLTPDLLELMARDYEESKEALERSSADSNREKEWGNPWEFAKPYEAYSSSTTPWLMWKHQKQVNKHAMAFLMRHPDALPPVPALQPLPTAPAAADTTSSSPSSTSSKRVDMLMGMLFGSTPSCKLRTARVPRLGGWQIDEYDGKESVVRL
ncbi:hypothetical protein Agub_g5628 [Astrephomene gubernaculifera]|uniref:Uncharacterized protein n=1 Tax=Astrephomene gubernaculifera TaxID=47775 RepID=A0AAD3DPN6_9CHLO|nr:hypothetical protein Agub_g5628 [Astrephomene gubernaculifera]